MHEFVPYHVPGVSEDYVETVALVVCELVTNAIRYGTEPGDSVRVVLDADDNRTRVGVHDPVRRRPRPRPRSGRTSARRRPSGLRCWTMKTGTASRHARIGDPAPL